MLVRIGAGEQDSCQLGLHLGVGQIRSPFFCHDDDVPRGQEPFVESEKFPEQAFYPVAPEGFPHLAPRHQPQSGAVSFPRSQGNAEVRRMQPFPPGLGPEVLPTAAKPLFSGKAGRLRG